MAAFYEQLMEAYPEAIMVLSSREDAEEWWGSANATIFQAIDRLADAPPGQQEMVLDLLDLRFTPGWREHDRSVAGYVRHDDESPPTCSGRSPGGVEAEGRLGPAVPGARS